MSSGPNPEFQRLVQSGGGGGKAQGYPYQIKAGDLDAAIASSFVQGKEKFFPAATCGSGKPCRKFDDDALFEDFKKRLGGAGNGYGYWSPITICENGDPVDTYLFRADELPAEE